MSPDAFPRFRPPALFCSHCCRARTCAERALTHCNCTYPSSLRSTRASSQGRSHPRGRHPLPLQGTCTVMGPVSVPRTALHTLRACVRQDCSGEYVGNTRDAVPSSGVPLDFDVKAVCECCGMLLGILRWQCSVMLARICMVSASIGVLACGRHVLRRCLAVRIDAQRCLAGLGRAWQGLAGLGTSSHLQSSRHQNNSTIFGFPWNPRTSCWHMTPPPVRTASPSRSLVSQRSFTGGPLTTTYLFHRFHLFHSGAVSILRDGATNTLTMPY